MTQVEILKLRTGEKDTALLESMLDGAKNYILLYTKRDITQWLPEFNSVQLSIALIDYNRRGAEGFSQRREGDISTSFMGPQDYPDSIIKTLNQYRLIKVI